MLSSLEVLKGAGSTLYGSDAIGGVVNVLTAPIEPGELRLLAGVGNFGVNEQHAVASYGHSWWQEEMAFARDFSSGFMPDRDYRNLALSSLSTLKSPLGATSLLFAYSDRPFGANDFYGAAEPQWERTKTWFASGHQNLGEKTEANFAYRKHTDLYVYIRDDPSLYTNWHTDEGWQGNLRRHENLPLHGVLSYGVEGLAESIHSTNLGIHSRERGSGYVFYDLRSVRRYSLSAGIREEVYGAHQVATSPSISGAAWLSGRFKMRASASRAFRLPSYTDIYYSSPSTIGNTNLKPESATSYEIGADAYLRTDLHASLTAVDRHDTNLVDYVQPAGTTEYQAQNLPPLNFMGVEASVVYEPRAGQHIAVSFSALHGQYSSPENIITEYTFNYPVHDAVVEWRGKIAKNVIGRTRLGVLNRVDMSPYAIWDASAGYATGRVRPFLQLTNITSTVYEEVPLVAMPKRGVIGGVELYLFGASR
jgi:iron complex outermembrane receptor protein